MGTTTTAVELWGKTALGDAMNEAAGGVCRLGACAPLWLEMGNAMTEEGRLLDVGRRGANGVPEMILLVGKGIAVVMEGKEEMAPSG